MSGGDVWVEREEYEFLLKLKNEQHEGQHRYWMYDAADGTWWQVTCGHSPMFLMKLGEPPEFSSLPRVVWGSIKAVVVHRLLVETSKVRSKLLDWAIEGW